MAYIIYSISHENVNDDSAKSSTTKIIGVYDTTIENVVKKMQTLVSNEKKRILKEYNWVKFQEYSSAYSHYIDTGKHLAYTIKFIIEQVDIQ